MLSTNSFSRSAASAVAGHFSSFRPIYKRHCIAFSDAVYGGEGASHDAVEQGIYNQDTAADYLCLGYCGYYESG